VVSGLPLVALRTLAVQGSIVLTSVAAANKTQTPLE
jgi:hypothetical protein